MAVNLQVGHHAVLVAGQVILRLRTFKDFILEKEGTCAQGGDGQRQRERSSSSLLQAPLSLRTFKKK